MSEDKYSAVVCVSEPSSRGLVAGMIADAGFEVVGETDRGLDTVDLAGITKPDLVLIEHELPFTTGLSFVGELREKAGSEVLLLTVDEHIRDEAAEAGAFGVVYLSRLPELEGALRRLREFLDSADERSAEDRRTGKDRRQHQDWQKVTTERRRGDRRVPQVEEDPGERRDGDRRQSQDWKQVTRERRAGDRRDDVET